MLQHMQLFGIIAHWDALMPTGCVQLNGAIWIISCYCAVTTAFLKINAMGTAPNALLSPSDKDALSPSI
jgi:hypothetical protein